MKNLFISALVSLCFLFCITPVAMANESLQPNEPEKFYITDATTLGDIVSHTEPEAYENLPIEMREKFDTTNAKTFFENEDNSTTPYVWPIIYSSLTIRGSNITSSSFDYVATYALSEPCPYIFVEGIIYDYDTGEIVSSACDFVYDSLYVAATGSAHSLNSSNPYRAVAFGDAIAPPNYVGSGERTVTEYIYLKN